jgi:hypothetical protein
MFCSFTGCALNVLSQFLSKNILENLLSNGHSTANLSSANFATVASARASNRGRVFDPFRVGVVTRKTRRHSQAVLRGLAKVLCQFSESGESGEFGECRLDLFMHIKYVICA